MELCFALINKTNIAEMTDELMLFLATCEPEFKADCSSNMFISMEKYAPNKRWHIDQMIRVLKTAGNYIRDDIIANFIILISNTPEMQYYAMSKLVQLIKDDVTQQPLVQVAVWCLGEYGDQLSSASQQESFLEEEKVTDVDIVNILINVLNYNAGLVVTREYAINALVKLSTRFSHLSE
jgi:AP-1 complex subunit gamma-1